MKKIIGLQLLFKNLRDKITNFKSQIGLKNFWQWAQNMKGRRMGAAFWDQLMNPWRKIFKDESQGSVDFSLFDQINQ